MTNEEYESVVARADDFLDMLKDTCHDQYDRIKELEERIEKAIEYVDHLKANAPDEIALEKILNILEGVENE